MSVMMLNRIRTDFGQHQIYAEEKDSFVARYFCDVFAKINSGVLSQIGNLKRREWPVEYHSIFAKAIFEIIKIWILSPFCAPKGNCCVNFARPEFGSGSICTGNIKFLSLSELSWLKAWFTFTLRITLGFRSPFDGHSLG